MGVMTCPHCEESIESLTRTGEKKYSCGQCNMVIKHDDVKPNLDEMEIDDQRGSSDSSDNSDSNTDSGSSSNTQGSANGNSDNSGPNHSLNEREKIYQRGTEGLKQIKKERLKNWLSTSEGVGTQTENRILMVFDRNESVHRNPHVLYNLLDDELKASASYVNTMVQDIFAPEEEHSDLLQSQGYTPYYNRGAMQQDNRANQGFGGPMNATGASGFNPGMQGGPQQQPQGQRNQPPSQQPNQQRGQGQGGGQGGSSGSDSPSSGSSDGSDPGSQPMSRNEAEMMMSQAMQQAEQQGQRNALLSGLSDATDEALREMATNVGGLAGTFQKVVDEALVGYARENPEWVIENMDILQKVLGATEDMPGEGQNQAEQKPQQDQKVDDALSNIGNQRGGDRQSASQEPRTTVSEPGGRSQNPQKAEPNPDLNDEHLSQSGFEPEGIAETENVEQDTTNESRQDTEEQTSRNMQGEIEEKPDPKPTPGEEASKESEQKRQEFESEDGDSESVDESFDEIFGDI